MESGLRASAPRLKSRQRRFGLRLLSLPQCDQAWEVVGAPTGVGERLINSVAYAGRRIRRRHGLERRCSSTVVTGSQIAISVS